MCRYLRGKRFDRLLGAGSGVGVIFRIVERASADLLRTSDAGQHPRRLRRDREKRKLSELRNRFLRFFLEKNLQDLQLPSVTNTSDHNAELMHLLLLMHFKAQIRIKIAVPSQILQCCEETKNHRLRTQTF